MLRNTGRAALAAVVIGCGTFAPPVQAQWRTRYVHREGLFHVEKYHTGNGITPTGAGVLIAGINAFAPIVGTVVGRETPEDREAAAQRDAARAQALAGLTQ